MKRFVLIVTLTLTAWCEPVLTAREAVSRALARHPSIEQQKQNFLAAQALSERVESDLFPHLSLEGVVKDGPPGAPNFRLPGLANAGFVQSGGGDLVLTQTFDFGRTSQLFSAERFNSLAEDHRQQALQEQVAWQVLRAYANLRTVHELVGLAEQSTAARAQMTRQAGAHFKAGLVSRVDSSLAQSDLGQSQADLIEAKAQEKTAWSSLSTAMGEPLIATGQLPTLDSPATTLETWDRSLEVDLESLESRPEIRSARDRVEAQTAKLAAARAGGNPILSIYAAGGYINNLAGPANSPNNYGVGAALSWPLFTAGGVEADIRQAEHRLAAARASEQETLQKLQGQMQAARLHFASLCERRQALEMQLVAAEDGWKLASSRYRLGLGSILEFQQAELSRLRAQKSLIYNRAEIWLAWLDLEYLTGRLIPDFTLEAKP